MWTPPRKFVCQSLLYFQGTVYFEDKNSFILKKFIWVGNNCEHFADKATEVEDRQTNMVHVS